MIHGWFTDIPLWRGRDGIRTPESGLAGRISRSESALELAGTEVLDGDGAIGDLIGITGTQCTTTTGTTPAVERFITGTISIAAEASVADPRAVDPSVAARDVAARSAVGLNAADSTASAAGFTTIPGPRRNLSKETGRRPAGMLNRAVRAASARALSAATITVERPGAIRRAETPVWVAAVVERLMVVEVTAVAGVIDQGR